MAFFTADFDEIAISSAWEAQTKAVRAHRLQRHNDILFQVVRDDIFSRRAEIHAALTMVAGTSLTPQGLSIPLWSYNTARYTRPYNTVVGTREFEIMEEQIQRKGYRWSVGLVPPGFDSAAFALNPEEEWDSIWRWLQPRSVDEIVRHTDFLNRIALLFGEYHFRISCREVSRKVLDHPLETVVSKMEIRLHYHPRGVYRWVRNSLQATTDKYEAHRPTELGSLCPYVWAGAVDVPPSPVPHAVPASPPPLARRSNGDGIARELFRSEANGTIRAYPLMSCYCDDSESE